MTAIIIGASASGLAAAIQLKRNIESAEVTVIERLDAPCKKLLATGNGRCNLTNTKAENYEEVSQFFGSLGLMLREEEERVYPYSLKAETVASVLLRECERLGIKIITQCAAERIDRRLNVYTNKGIFKANRVIVCTGGCAQSNLGSNGSGYEFLTLIGHSVTPVYPALVQLISSSRYPRMIKGTRTKCLVSAEIEGEIKKSEYGEVLFTDYGLSGIAVMNLSGVFSEILSRKKSARCTAIIDLIPEMSREEVLSYLERFGDLKGILGTKLSDIIMKQADGDLTKASAIAKGWRLIITGTKGFDFAQIASGGIPLNEVDNFKSKKVKGLYICGEILDRQFECGGFNLDFAFHSGITAANMITEEFKNDKN